MVLRVTFRNQQIGRQYSTAIAARSARNKRALKAAMGDARDEILRRGRADIAGAGKFGRRWTEGFKGLVTEHRGDFELQMSHDVPYFPVHQEGRVIHGRPLLWIPLSFSDAVGKRARDYPGGLFRVDRKVASKRPLLLSIRDKEPKYFGIESVKIPKRFHVLEIIREVAKKIPKLFTSRVKEG